MKNLQNRMTPNVGQVGNLPADVNRPDVDPELLTADLQSAAGYQPAPQTSR
jgi:hypothetical protein